MAYFPMYIDIENKTCLVIGGGDVAYRKVSILLDFKADVKVVAPKVSDQIKSLSDITVYEREFLETDLVDCDIVIAATDSKDINHRVSLLCKEKKIMVNAVDEIKDCTFIFPSYIKQGDVVASFSSSGNSPVVTQYLKEQNKNIVIEKLGRINDFLGNYRLLIKKLVDEPGKRKEIFKGLLRKGLDSKKILEEKDIYEIVNDSINDK